MSAADRATRVSVRDFAARKTSGEPIVMVAAYDALFARLADESGVDAILVGDSVANVVAGQQSTLSATLDQMIYHGAAVVRGASRAMVLVDMPFLSYQVSKADAMRNCGRVMQETGAQAVKVEGGTMETVRAVRAVVRLGVPVMGHLGFTPQSVHQLGGPRVQGRDTAGADRMLDAARRLEEAGAFSVVLELIPGDLAQRISESITIPTIGIGAGVGCGGQVLVLADLLGLTDTFAPKFLRRYAEMAGEVRRAVTAFGDDVRARRYPDADHTF